MASLTPRCGSRIRKFAQPSEVQEPIELVRAGVLFHARGIVNAKAIQHNLDWVWPYWVERQFDPDDISFIPRSFSLSHINLTHRNWTALGLPELPIYPIVDPRGLVTPVQDGWSIDFWLLDPAGKALVPSRTARGGATSKLVIDNRHSVVNHVAPGRTGALSIRRSVSVLDGQPRVGNRRAGVEPGGRLARAGHSSLQSGRRAVHRRHSRPARMVMAGASTSGWKSSPIGRRINWSCPTMKAATCSRLQRSRRRPQPRTSNGLHRTCSANGMATAASIYRFNGPLADLTVRVPLDKELAAWASASKFDPAVTWPAIRSKVARSADPGRADAILVRCGRADAVLLSADEVVPGPYTYRRFWFRDACLMLNALLAIGLTDRCRRAIEHFPERQLRNGYFRSQEGEWDSNGQVLWIIDRYAAADRRAARRKLARSRSTKRWTGSIANASPADSEALHAGLLPAGFSAEHLGPNDHYYWDDFWAEAGLRAAERIFNRAGRRSGRGERPPTCR